MLVAGVWFVACGFGLEIGFFMTRAGVGYDKWFFMTRAVGCDVDFSMTSADRPESHAFA